MMVVAIAFALLTAQPADLGSEARALEDALIAPCCFTQQVSVHQSAAAEDVRRDIRRRLSAGESRQDILDAYVRQYGKRVLAVPPASGFDRGLYIVPAASFLVSALIVSVVVGRLTRRRTRAPAERPEAPRPEDAARLDDELREMD